MPIGEAARRNLHSVAAGARNQGTTLLHMDVHGEEQAKF